MGTAYNSTFAGLKLLATFAQESRRERKVSVSDSASNLLGFYPALSDSDIQKRSEMKNVLCHGSVITKYGHKGLDLRAGCFVPALLWKGFCLFTVSDTTERGGLVLRMTPAEL